VEEWMVRWWDGEKEKEEVKIETGTYWSWVECV